MTSRAWTSQPPAGLPKHRRGFSLHHRLPSLFHSAREQPAEMTTVTAAGLQHPDRRPAAANALAGFGKPADLAARWWIDDWHAVMAGTDPQRLGRVDRRTRLLDRPSCCTACPRDQSRLGYHLLTLRTCPYAAHRHRKAPGGGTVGDCNVAVLSLDPVVLVTIEEALVRPLGGGAA